MSDNKFILQLKGTQTPKSVVEIKNDKLVAPFVNVPGSSDVVGSIIPDKDSSVVVAKGAENWQLDGGALVPATNLTGNGADFTGEYAVSGSGLWVNAVYTFPSTGDPAHPVAEIFNPQTKWVLQLCGKNLHTGSGNTIDFSFIVKIGSSHIMTKTVTVSEQANFFCKRFVLDFSESEQSIIKASGGSNLTVQLLCADDSASATIYNGMTILTALQRRIDASEVSASFANVEEVLRNGLLPNDYFSNAEFIDEIEDGEQAYAVFERDGDNVNLAGWTPKDEVARKDEIIVKSATIPTASADLLGAVYQYVGQTDSTYEHGYIYECVAETTTETLIMFDPVDTGKLGFDYQNHSVYELFDRIAALTTPTFGPQDVVSGSFRLDKVNELWYISGYDANGNALFTDFTVEATGGEYCLDGYGYIYTFPFPDDYEDGHTENYRIQETQSGYAWERIDVQPGGSRGRFLSLWDCTTGLAETNPPISPYEYKTGDYFVVGVVGATNYRPDGTAYVVGVPSATVETAEVAVDDTYFFDGTTWKLQSNSNKTVSFSGIAGSPYDNTALSNALNGKVDETSTANQVYGTDNNGDQTTYNITDFGAVDDVKVNNVSVVTSKIANIDLTNYVTLSTTQAITGTKTFKAEILSWNNITFESAQANPIIRAMSGASYRNMITRTNSASAIDVGNTSDTINLKGSGTRPTYNSNDLAMYSDIPAQVNSDWNANSGVAEILNKPTLGTMAAESASDYTPTASLATVATTGDYDDLINKPTIPAAQINSDWNANSGVAEILNKPTLGTAAAANTTDFATAAQGAKADTALQSGDNVSELINDAGYLVMGDLTGFVTRTTAQTISGLKTFSADIVLSGTTSIKNTTSGVSYTMLYRDTSGIHVGTSTQALLLAGSGTRPTFNSNNMALLSDVPTAVSQLSNDSGFITNAVNDLQNYTLSSSLATVATSGDYDDLLNKPAIPTVNDATITITQGGVTKGSFTLNQASGDTIVLDAGGGSSVAIDNTTITKNTSDEIQAVATVNANTASGATNPIYDWVGTLAEYTAQNIETTHPDWLCYITDDVSGGASVYTKAEVDASFVAKGHQVIEFQEPTSSNGYTWYRKYADGWVEQGGSFSSGGSGNTTITLPVEMADSNYKAKATRFSGASTTTNVNVWAREATSTTQFVVYASGDTGVAWEVKGMAA